MTTFAFASVFALLAIGLVLIAFGLLIRRKMPYLIAEPTTRVGKFVRAVVIAWTYVFWGSVAMVFLVFYAVGDPVR